MPINNVIVGFGTMIHVSDLDGSKSLADNDKEKICRPLVRVCGLTNWQLRTDMYNMQIIYTYIYIMYILRLYIYIFACVYVYEWMNHEVNNVILFRYMRAQLIVSFLFCPMFMSSFGSREGSVQSIEHWQ